MFFADRALYSDS